MLAELPSDETTTAIRAELYAALGDLYYFEDHLQAAASYYQNALRLFQQIDAKLGQANTLKSLGDLAMRVDDLTSAAQHFQNALSLFQQIDAKLGQANTRAGLGDLYDRLDQPDEAIQQYDLALETFREIRDRYSIARTILLSVGPFLTRRGQVEAAFENYALGLLVTLDMDSQFFIAFQEVVVQRSQELAQSQPEQAAAGCAALLSELKQAQAEAGPSSNDQEQALLGLAALLFQAIQMAALAAGQSGPERQARLAQAQQLAQQVDAATEGAFGLAAWVEGM
jgi:tetratricopeptide (TPR) repeat protein